MPRGGRKRLRPSVARRLQVTATSHCRLGPIATRMGLSEATVRTHMQNIHARLEVSSRTAAVQRVFGADENWL
jgi:DNA-binding CsgD family transcriptional regulator